jgi:hypothetical protein
VSSIRWTNGDRPHLVYLAAAQPEPYGECGADSVVQTQATGGWAYLSGLEAAIAHKVNFAQAVCLQDSAVFMGAQFDTWLAQTIYRERADLISVAERNCWVDSFLLVGAHFSRWRVPHEMWDKPPAIHTASDAVVCLSRRFVFDLFHRRLLSPTHLTDWPLPFSCYITWLCYLLHFSVHLVGSMDRPLAPFYVNDGFGGHYNPPPYILHPGFLFYATLQRVAAQTEADMRRWCRQMR